MKSQHMLVMCYVCTCTYNSVLDIVKYVIKLYELCVD